MLTAAATYRAQYENPIQRGRDADASDAQAARGLAAMGELMALINSFMLRRTSTVLKKLLPAKVEQVRAARARARRGRGVSRRRCRGVCCAGAALGRALQRLGPH